MPCTYRRCPQRACFQQTVLLSHTHLDHVGGRHTAKKPPRATCLPIFTHTQLHKCIPSPNTLLRAPPSSGLPFHVCTRNMLQLPPSKVVVPQVRGFLL